TRKPKRWVDAPISDFSLVAERAEFASDPQHPPRSTRSRGSSGAVRAHHSHMFPLVSYRPKAFGVPLPTAHGLGVSNRAADLDRVLPVGYRSAVPARASHS